MVIVLFPALYPPKLTVTMRYLPTTLLVTNTNGSNSWDGQISDKEESGLMEPAFRGSSPASRRCFFSSGCLQTVSFCTGFPARTPQEYSKLPLIPIPEALLVMLHCSSGPHIIHWTMCQAAITFHTRLRPRDGNILEYRARTYGLLSEH